MTGNGAQPDLKHVAARCTEGKGYLLFAAIMTHQLDSKGHRKIEFEYRRHHLNFEDAKQAARVLKRFVDEEILKAIEPTEEDAQDAPQDDHLPGRPGITG